MRERGHADAPGGLDPLAPVEAEVERDPEPLRRVREGAVQRVAEAAHHVPGLGDERQRVGQDVAAVEALLRQQRRDVEAVEGGVRARQDVDGVALVAAVQLHHEVAAQKFVTGQTRAGWARQGWGWASLTSRGRRGPPSAPPRPSASCRLRNRPVF